MNTFRLSKLKTASIIGGKPISKTRIAFRLTKLAARKVIIPTIIQSKLAKYIYLINLVAKKHKIPTINPKETAASPGPKGGYDQSHKPKKEIAKVIKL